MPASVLAPVSRPTSALAPVSTGAPASHTPDEATRALAALLEERGEFGRSLALWESIVRDNPNDVIAGKKVRDLAARVATGKVYAARKANRAGGRA